MSDMDEEAVFTLRDLNRKPAEVLKACDLYGHVKIRTRAGKSYRIQAEQRPRKKSRSKFDIRPHWKRLRELGCIPPGPEDMDRINRIIAGEE